ncbi:hypothetical protein GCM10022221_67370 [Actinocorallia aurea]
MTTHDTIPDFSPPIGTFGLARIGGFVGFLVSLGQLLIGDASRYTHAFVVVGDGKVIEAMPSGARLAPLSRFDGQPVAYSWAVPLDDGQRKAITRAAIDLVGTPYGFGDYVALALARCGVSWGWLDRFLASNRTLICSQLVALTYAQAGVDLFADGRPMHTVTPGDLANVLIEREWNRV